MSAGTILVVEDESVIALNVAETLRRFGYTVCAMVSSGEDAVREARQLHPDLVLMDIRLEGEMDGLTASALIGDSLGIPVVFLTAHADQDTIDRAKVTMPYGYVLKPCKDGALRAAVELALFRAAKEEVRGAAANNQTGRSREAVPGSEELSAKTAKIQAVLRGIQAFSTLSDATLARMAQGSREESVPANTQIMLEGDKVAAGFLVLSGRVALVKSSESGRDLAVELMAPGDSLALAAAASSEHCLVAARAQIDSTVLWIPRSRLMLAFDECPELSRTFLRELFLRLGSSHDLARSLAHDSVEIRVAAALSTLVPRFGVGQAVPFTLKMTRQELADITGSTSETVIRTTKAMERAGLLDLSRAGRIRVLNLERLRGMAGAAA
jgi:CRP-like cAMP-binding protein/CheY-like chemotaxis protein